MKSPAVIINANAGGVRSDPGIIERIRERLPFENVRVTHEPSQIEPALAELLATDSDTLVIVGGDGSAGGTLTALIAASAGRELPRVVMAGGGSVNTIARSLGARGRPDVNIGRWIRASEPRFERVHPLLEITAGNEPPRYGMLFGAGLIARWLENYYKTGGGPVAAALTLAGSVASVLVRGRQSRELFKPFDVTRELDDEPALEKNLTGMIASTVRDIGLGFQPFTTAGESPDRFHWIETDASGGRFALELPAQLFRWESRGSSLDHASPQRVRIRAAVPLLYMIDADLFPPTRELCIAAGPAIRFASP